MWSAATIADTLKHDAEHYGFSGGPEAATTLNFPKLKAARDAYVKRLNGIYGNGFTKAGVEDIRGEATFVDQNTVEVKVEDGSTKTITAAKILVATGGRPMIPPGVGVAENVISSDGFFDLEELPKVAVVVGAGYIAVELAGVLNSLGTEVHLVVRKAKALREFDPMISDALDAEMINAGIHIHRNTGGIAKIEVENGKKQVTTVAGDTLYGADVVLMVSVCVSSGAGITLAYESVCCFGIYICNIDYTQIYFLPHIVSISLLLSRHLDVSLMLRTSALTRPALSLPPRSISKLTSSVTHPWITSMLLVMSVAVL